jgi:hypothetical protein
VATGEFSSYQHLIIPFEGGIGPSLEKVGNLSPGVFQIYIIFLIDIPGPGMNNVATREESNL